MTPHHWKYAWLSEGLATFSSAKILNKVRKRETPRSRVASKFSDLYVSEISVGNTNAFKYGRPSAQSAFGNKKFA